MSPLEILARGLYASQSPYLFVTGAGVSLASGIPTFRGTDPGAVWSVDVTTLGTRRYFEQNPVGSWSWYLKRFGGLADKLPNPAHHALAELEKLSPNCFLVTQNVDTLHEQAGSMRLAKVHGSADKVRCSRQGCKFGSPKGMLLRPKEVEAAFLLNPSFETLPRCPECKKPLRQHVLWFDESYNEHESYRFNTVLAAGAIMSNLVFVGTSFSVGITAILLNMAEERKVPTWSIDPGGLKPEPWVQVVARPAEEALPELVEIFKSL
jgi:NAD-dependent deacetylase